MNKTNKSITALILSVAIVSLPGCKSGSVPSWINDATVTSAFAAATTTGLKLGISDTEKRKAMANLLQFIATQARTFVGVTTNNDPNDLAIYINDNIPANIKEQYPELIAFAVPLVIAGYQAAYSHYGNNAKDLSHWLNAAATGIETGAATFSSKN